MLPLAVSLLLLNAPVTEVGGRIEGVVKDSETQQALESARLILVCDCLAAGRETVTDERGAYSFSELPSGPYELQVRAGRSAITKVFDLPAETRMRANFTVNPRQGVTTTIAVASPAPAPEPAPAPRFKVEVEWNVEVEPTRLPGTSCRVIARCSCLPPTQLAFRLSQSLFDGGDIDWLTQTPPVIRSLL